jgi:hypothetical protein
MRVIARKERPHPGAQLRITDVDGLRVTAFATNTATGGPGTQLPDLELRHRRRACAEDRVRCSKNTGLLGLPLHDFAQNQIWCAIVALAVELTAWMQMLALTDHQAPGGNPNGCGCGCSPSRPPWREPAAKCCCTLCTSRPGPTSSVTPSTGCAPPPWPG